MEIFGMSLSEILIVVAIILILVDIFFASDIPTHIAYVLLTLTFVKEIDTPILYQILFGLIIWSTLIVFHYLIWRKIIEKINDKIIAPTIHRGGFDGFVGKEGVVKEIDGKQLISINDELHQFETEKEVIIGKKYKILNTNSNKLII